MQTVRGPTLVWQVQPRQAPRPQAIFFSRLARQGVPAAAQSFATPRIMTMGPQVSTISYRAASSRSVTRP